MRAYLTGDEEPTTFVCRLLRVPNVDWFAHAVNGLISELTKPYVWEQYGDVTAEEAAELGMIMFDNYLDSINDRVGVIFMCLWASIPDEAHELDGTTLVDAEDDYPILWGKIASTFKSGSNIVLPDWRDKFPFVPGDGDIQVFDTGGSFSVTLTEAKIPAHRHSISVQPTTQLSQIGAGGPTIINAPIAGQTGSTGGGEPFYYMPEFFAPRFCIWLE